MDDRNIEWLEKRVENELSAIGAKIAQATDNARQALACCAACETLLLTTQQMISELYISLEKPIISE